MATYYIGSDNLVSGSSDCYTVLYVDTDGYDVDLVSGTVTNKTWTNNSGYVEFDAAKAMLGFGSGTIGDVKDTIVDGTKYGFRADDNNIFVIISGVAIPYEAWGSGTYYGVGGSGTIRTIPMWSGAANELADSIVTQNAGDDTITVGGKLVVDTIDAAALTDNILFEDSGELQSMAVSSFELDDEQINHSIISGSTYKTLEDWWNNTQSAGFITGGTISDNGDGSATVGSGTGIIKTTDSDIGSNVFFDWAEDDSVSLTDNNTNWIYLSYSSGSPEVDATVDITSLDLHTEIVIGRVYRDGTTLYIYNVGQDITDYMTKACYRDFEIHGFERASGLSLAEEGERYLSLTAGVLYCAHNRETISALNTNNGDRFSYWYRANGGGWTEVTDQAQISNTNYDDGDGTLGTVGSNDYGVHLVYVLQDGSLHVQYGQDDYNKLGEAEASAIPTPPPLLRDFGLLVGKVIIERDASNIDLILSPLDTQFTVVPVTDHGDLAGLSDDDHPQYAALAQNEIVEGDWAFSGSTTFSGTVAFSGATSGIVLNELDDVDAGSPSDGDSLVWVEANSKWEPSAVSGAAGSGSGDVVQGTSHTDNYLTKWESGTAKDITDSILFDDGTDATVAGNLIVSGTSTMSGSTTVDDITIGGSGTIAETLDVTGLTTVDDLVIGGSGTVAETLDVTGNISTAAGLSVGTSASVTEDLEVTGEGGFGTLVVDGEATVDDLVVGGSGTIGETLDVTGNVTIGGTTTIGGDILVDTDDSYSIGASGAAIDELWIEGNLSTSDGSISRGASKVIGWSSKSTDRHKIPIMMNGNTASGYYDDWRWNSSAMSLSNLGAQDFIAVGVVPLPTVRGEGTLQLQIYDFLVNLLDADNGDEWDRVYVYAHSGRTSTLLDSQTALNNYNTGIEYSLRTDIGWTTTDVSAYDWVHLRLDFICTNANDLDCKAPLCEYYYS